MSRFRRIRSVPGRIPLRVQLVAALLVLTALGMAVLGFTSTALLRSNLLQRKDTELQQTVQGILHGGGSAFGPGGNPYASGGNGYGYSNLGRTNASWFEFVTTNGTRISSAVLVPGSESTQTGPALPQLTSSTLAGFGMDAVTVSPTGAGARWRLEILPATDEATGQAGYFLVAITQDDVDSTVSRLIDIDLLVGSGVVLLLGLAGWLVVRASLRPLVDVEHTAEAIAAGDLSRRVPVRSDRTEVGRLSAALNTMLGHIEVAFQDRSRSEAAALATAEQMRRFAADASHELRTPLTSIRGFAELSRSGVIPPGPDTDRAMERIENEAIRMTGLVEDLLLLARLDQQRPLEANPVDLLAIAADAVHDATAIAPDHETTLVVADPASAEPIVLGDEPRLRQVVTNLVANALHHTPAGTHVRVGVQVHDRTAVLEVTDDGPGLSPADARKVFERFYRADSSRARTSGGAGLGLSIVAALVSAHGGTVDLHTAPGRGARFSVRIPLAQGQAALSGAVPAVPVPPAVPAGSRPGGPGPVGPGFLPPPEPPAGSATEDSPNEESATDGRRALTR